MLTVVTGPPAAGKTTLVHKHARHGDVVIDLDAIACALTVGAQHEHDHPKHLLPIAQAARFAAIKAAMPLHHRGHRVWVIDTSPSAPMLRWYQREQARMVHVDPGPEVRRTRLDARQT